MGYRALEVSLEHCTRSEAENRIEDLGGRSASSVSSNTDYVVAGADPGQKLEQAKSEQVEILNETELEELLKKLTYFFSKTLSKRTCDRPL